ncbi:MAG: LysR family transcriptional regulator [Cellvibrionaceae bacterium]|nr:LysR family transcriptional regulator [Cellvibrionaceae bacterium]
MAKWDGINEFVQVAEDGSFTSAAQKLGISTAQVSRLVSALEHRLNVKLMYRTTRKVSLTHEGEAFYGHCRNLIDGLEAAEHSISHQQDSPRGKIKLTAPVNFADRRLAPALNDFLLKHPDIEIDAYFTNRQIDLVDEGYDLAIRLGKLEDSSLIAKRLSHRNSYLCAAPEYLSTHGTPEKLSDLKSHNCLAGSLNHWRFLEDGSYKNIRVKGRAKYNSGEALLDAALKGLGIVQLPDYYVNNHLRQGRLQSFLNNFQDHSEGVWCVYPSRKYLSPRIRVLIEFLSERLSGDLETKA